MKEKNVIKTKRYESPCGVLLLGSFGDKLCLCDWQVEKHRSHVDKRLKRILRAEFEEGTSEVIEQALLQLDEFLQGNAGNLMYRCCSWVRISRKRCGTNC